MVFQQPFFLYWLFLLTIPILIHFLNFRKSKTLYFSSLRFIDEVKSTYRKRNRLKDLLVLLLRLLILASLIIAFAQPVIQSKNIKTPTPFSVTGIFIDNSQSMAVAEQGKSLLSIAKLKAKEIVSEFPPNSRFQVSYFAPTTDLPGLSDKELTLKYIDQIQQSASQISLAEILGMFQQTTSDGDNYIGSIILISDFQNSLFSIPLKAATYSPSVYLVPIKALATDNISVDTCWLNNPLTMTGQNNLMVARIKNRSDTEYENFPVRLMINDTLRNETTIKLPAKAITEVELNFHPNSVGWQIGAVQISDFPIVFDNDLHFAFKIESEIPVLLLHGDDESKFIRGVFSSDPYFKFESYGVKGFPRSDFNDFNLVILAGVDSIDSRNGSKLRDFMIDGGTVWFLPELSGHIFSYNQFLKLLNAPEIQAPIPFRVESRIANDQNQWLQEVVVSVDKRLRLPFFNKSLKMQESAQPVTNYLSSVTGDMLLSQYRVGKGSFVLSAFPLDEGVTDMMFHPLFIPICYRIASISKRNTPLYQVIGQNNPFSVFQTIQQSEQPVKLKNVLTGFETIPTQKAKSESEIQIFPGSLPTPGIYSSLIGIDTVSKVAFNHSLTESDLSYASDSLIRQELRTAGWNIPMNNNSLTAVDTKSFAVEIASIKLWYYFLIIALVALFAESLVMNMKK
jgi:hypothetical protein